MSPYLESVLPVHIMTELKVHARACDIEPMVQADDLRVAFSKRLKQAISASGMDEWGAGARLAKIAGVTPKAVSKWMNGESIPGPAKMLTVAKELNVRREWLQFAEGSMRPGESAGAAPAPHSRITDRPGFIEIPQLDVRGSMGSGAARPDTVDVIQRMTVSMDFLRQSVSFSNATNLALITGYGDSMEGTFNDGDLLLVDRGVNEVKIDAVYVLSLNDELYIKRLQRRGDGTFSMISDNRRYDPIQITGKDLERFQVLGRVLLAWNARKL